MLSGLLQRAAVVAVTAVAATMAPGLFTTEAQAASPQLYGVQLHSLWSENTAADVDRQLDLLDRLGATTARVDVGWSSLMTDGPGQISTWYRDRLDSLVAKASARGLRLIVTLAETPCWASSAPESLKLGCVGAWWDRDVTRYPPTRAADYGDAAAWVAARYGSRIAALEVWNEPNHPDPAWARLLSADQATAYAALVKAAYPAVKQVAPTLPLLAGAISFGDVAFVEALYARGLKGFYDGLSIHPYNEWRAPGSPHDPQWAKYDLVMGTEAVHNTMLAHGDLSPMWITETGWTTCVVGSSKPCVTEAQQAAYLEATLPIVQGWSFVRALVFYGLRNKGTDARNSEHMYGMVRQDYSEKPAVAAVSRAFRAATTASVPPTPSATPTPTPTPSATPTGSATPMATKRLRPRTRRFLVAREPITTVRLVAGVSVASGTRLVLRSVG